MQEITTRTPKTRLTDTLCCMSDMPALSSNSKGNTHAHADFPVNLGSPHIYIMAYHIAELAFRTDKKSLCYPKLVHQYPKLLNLLSTRLPGHPWLLKQCQKLILRNSRQASRES